MPIVYYICVLPCDGTPHIRAIRCELYRHTGQFGWVANFRVFFSACAVFQRDSMVQSMAAASTDGSVVPSELLLAIGVMSAPQHAHRRHWLRDASRRFRQQQVLQRFVLGRVVMPEAPAAQPASIRLNHSIETEVQQYGDIIRLSGIAESARTSCIEKSFAWWSLALDAFPHASFVAKTDDDALNIYPQLVRLLTAAPFVSGAREPLIYAGWSQYSSFIPDYNVACGWAFGPRVAIENTERGNCKTCISHPFCYDKKLRGWSRAPLSASIRGPFIFAVGALQIMSASLIRRVFSSPFTRTFADRARHPCPPGVQEWAEPERPGKHQIWGAGCQDKRSSQRLWWHPWKCKAEDATVGYVVAEAALNQSLHIMYVDLGQVIDDAGKHSGRAANAAVNLGKVLTVHGLEVDMQKLRKRAAADAGKFGPQLQLMQAVLPKLEALNGALPRTEQRHACYSQTDVQKEREARRAKRVFGAHEQRIHRNIVLILTKLHRDWSFCQIFR